jgi:RNA polymerase sigma-70 factor, ECF subfamily
LDHSNPPVSDEALLQRVRNGDEAAFEQIFLRHYKNLCLFSLRYVSVGEVAEELVADVLVQLWQKQRMLPAIHSLQSYLYTSVRNASLNYVKSQYARQRFLGEANQAVAPELSDQALEAAQLEALIAQGIDALPPGCRVIFTLSRQAGMSYEEIARELGLSPKTVKAQMGIALRKLRTYLGKHWDTLLILLTPMLP